MNIQSYLFNLFITTSTQLQSGGSRRQYYSVGNPANLAIQQYPVAVALRKLWHKKSIIIQYHARAMSLCYSNDVSLCPTVYVYVVLVLYAEYARYARGVSNLVTFVYVFYIYTSSRNTHISICIYFNCTAAAGKNKRN